jgi:hypothetical protein
MCWTRATLSWRHSRRSGCRFYIEDVTVGAEGPSEWVLNDVVDAATDVRRLIYEELCCRVAEDRLANVATSDAQARRIRAHLGGLDARVAKQLGVDCAAERRRASRTYRALRRSRLARVRGRAARAGAPVGGCKGADQGRCTGLDDSCWLWHGGDGLRRRRHISAARRAAAAANKGGGRSLSRLLLIQGQSSLQSRRWRGGLGRFGIRFAVSATVSPMVGLRRLWCETAPEQRGPRARVMGPAAACALSVRRLG